MRGKCAEHVIDRVEPGSIAEELEIEAGDVLVSVNGQMIEDVFDYHYLINDDYLEILIRKPDGEEWEMEIEKDYQEDLGIIFDNGLMDDYKSCTNKCIFCFIDQMPPGMRETLYFKDDDSRLSFLQGNYVTLTNMKDHDLERIITYKLAPINISVHTTNPQLRCEMLHNRFAGEALKKIDRLYEGGIEMNGQVVCCKGINDGEELDRTIRDLTKYIPFMESLSVVPVGLTKYREGLCELQLFEKEDAREVIAIIEKWQRYCMEHFGIHFVQASDEWYLTAELPLPEEERYDGYIQLENGVGMIRLLLTEYREALADLKKRLWEYHSMESGEEEDDFAGFLQKMGGNLRSVAEAYYQAKLPEHITMASGKLMAPFLEKMAQEYRCLFPDTRIDVIAIRNDFFGENITVSGLITGGDLIRQLQEKGDNGERVLIPVNMLRSGEEVFLDDLTLSEVEKALQVPFTIVQSSGQNLLDAIMDI